MWIQSFLVLVATGVVGIAADRPALAASSKECVSVQIEAPFRLPDGILREAGELTLCDARAFSPVVQFHAILIDGATVGMFTSRRRTTESGPIPHPEVLFERDAEGTLALVGYVVPKAGRSLAFRMRPEPRRAAAEVAGLPAPAPPIAAIVAVTAH
jgi:hypothetical protein